MTLIFAESQVRMANVERAHIAVWHAGLVVPRFALCLVRSFGLIRRASVVRALLTRPLTKPRLKPLAAVSLFFTLVSLIPFSTVGFFMLPAALAALASSMLLVKSSRSA